MTRRIESGSAHSPLGPSSAKRWINCPGSVRATGDLPDTDSVYALEGTAAHQLAERARRDDYPARSYLGLDVRVEKVDGTFAHFIVDEEMADAVQQYIDHVNGLPGLDFNESRVHYGQFVPEGFGTMDAARGTDDVVYIRDLKYGKGVQVWAEDNEQLMLYALGFHLTYGYLFDQAYTHFNVGIVQPRLDHIDTWQFSVKELLDWVENVAKPAALRTQDADAPFKAGEWCQFCKIKATCKTRAESVFAAAVGEFEDLDEAAGKASKLAVNGALTNDQIAVILNVLPQIQQWCKDIKAYASGEILQGRPVGDYKFVAGRGSREWKVDVDTAIARINDVDRKVQNNDELFDPATFKSPAQVEKIIGKKVFAAIADELVKKTPGAPTLVPGSDKRPSVAIDPSTEFDNIEE